MSSSISVVSSPSLEIEDGVAMVTAINSPKRTATVEPRIVVCDLLAPAESLYPPQTCSAVWDGPGRVKVRRM